MPDRTPLLDGIRPPGNSFVLPDHKMVYISVTKVACTALRWMVADLAGEDFNRFYSAAAAHQSRLMTIHTNRTSWQFVPQIKDVAPELLPEISRDNGWFIFAMVRDPWSRLWSGWQSKFLVGHTYYRKTYGREPWYPRVPQTATDVVADWARFVRARPWVSNAALAGDVHFQPQVNSVRPEGVNYTRIYDLSNMSELIADIQQHLQSIGKSRELYLPRANETPLALTAEVLADGIREEIEDAYRPDFDAFGERWNFGALTFAPDGWTPDAIRAAAFHTVANERIGDLSKELRETQRKAARAAEQVNELKRELAAAQRRVVESDGRATLGPAPIRRSVTRGFAEKLAVQADRLLKSRR